MKTNILVNIKTTYVENGSRSILCVVAMMCLLLTIGVENVLGAVNNGDLFERISANPSANDEVIFVKQSGDGACGTTQNTNNRNRVSITTSSNQYIYNSSDNVQVFVVKTNASGKFGFHTGSGYIYSASNSNNNLKTNTTAASTAPSTTSAWTLSFSSSVLSATNVTNTSYYLAFNTSSALFSQYKSNQSKPYLYKKVMSAPTTVAASNITSDGATITITDGTDVNNYEVYCSTSSTAPTAGSSGTTSTSKSVSLTGLNANTTYYVWARAYSTSPARKTGWVALTGTTFKTAAASKTLSSIAITTQPTKRAYLVGETFSKTGAVVTATYSDETTANVSTSATWTPTTGLASGSNTITASYTEGGVTKTATTTVTGYTITIQVKDVDNNTISGAGAPTASPSGASISASASGNNYVFKRWVAVTAAGTSFADANNRSTTLSGTPTGNVTIKAEYYKPINITWNANGSAYTPGTPGTAQVGYGALMSSLTVPSPAPSTATFCGEKFVGWTTEENVAQDDDTGLNLFTSVAGNTTPITADMDFYAVFADYDD